MNLIRTNSLKPDFRELCLQLDNELAAGYGNAQSIYDVYNIIEDNKNLIIGYLNSIPVGGSCFKIFSEDSFEIKRRLQIHHRRLRKNHAAPEIFVNNKKRRINMSECEVLSTCPFFNDKMADMPATADSLKRKYCQGDNTKCARYMVFKALGKPKVPPGLFPGQDEKAR